MNEKERKKFLAKNGTGKELKAEQIRKIHYRKAGFKTEVIIVSENKNKNKIGWPKNLTNYKTAIKKKFQYPIHRQ